MFEISLLISVCIIVVFGVPVANSAFAPALFIRKSVAKRRPGTNPSKSPTSFQTVEQISTDAKKTFASLRRRDGAKSRLVEISRIVRESPDTLSLIFSACLSKEYESEKNISEEDARLAQTSPELPSFKPGQHIVFHRPAIGTQPATRRCYSLSGSPSDRTWRITVKNQSATSMKGRQSPIHDSSVSSWIHQHARVGDRFVVTGPQGRFTLDLASDTKPVLFIAAGVGITPIASMLNHEMRFSRTRKKWLFYQVSDLDHAPLLGELAQKIDLEAGFRAVVACSRDSRLLKRTAIDPSEGLSVIGGKLDAPSIIAAVDTTEVTVLMCGPNAWMESMKSGFVAAGVASSNIHYESFGEPTADSSPISNLAAVENNSGTIGTGNTAGKVSFSVEFETNGMETIFDGAHSDLLSHAKANNIELPSGCRMGNCGSCTVKLLKGTIAYSRPPESVLAPDEILPCICYPTSDLVVQG